MIRLENHGDLYKAMYLFNLFYDNWTSGFDDSKQIYSANLIWLLLIQISNVFICFHVYNIIISNCKPVN